MRRYFDLVVAGSLLFLCLFFALILLSISTTSDSGLLSMFTGFLALIFVAVAGGFQLILATLRLIFKLDARRFWARASLIALVFTVFSLIYAAIAGSAETGLLTFALGIFTVLGAVQSACAWVLSYSRTRQPRSKNPKSSPHPGKL